MLLAINEIACAREAVTGLLEELGLDAYLFEIEPYDTRWELKVECAIVEGWKTTDLHVPKKILQDSLDDTAIHKRLLEEWRHSLAACKTEAGD